MLKLSNITKYYPSKLGNQFVFKDLNFEFPDNRNIAILGANGAGKSTLFRMLAKSEYPNKGKIITDKNISWPVALAAGVHRNMTGQENARFIAKVNGVADIEAYEERVREFVDVGDRYYLPVSSYSSGMRARVGFACATAIDFDIYLIDEATSVGDAKFRKKAKEKLVDTSKKSNVIMVSHQMDELRLFCDSAVVINNGELKFYDELEQGISEYEQL